MLLLVLACAAPAWAVEVKLKAEDKDFNAAILKLEDGVVTYRKGRKEHTAQLTDFELPSQFAIMDDRLGDTGPELMKLARFALHRGLYAEAQQTAARAAKLDDFKEQADKLSAVAFSLEADAVLDKAVAALDAKDTEKAKPLLQDVIKRFANTPAAVKADILLGTLKRVELEVRAAELEKEAKQAQADADAEEAKRRAPIDDWLAELDGQVDSNADTKKEADNDCVTGYVNKGLPKYEDIVQAMQTLRKSITKNRNLLKYRGENTQADTIDDKARKLIIECYYNWAYYLYQTTRYDVAATVCKHGIDMDPTDRRFLSLKVDIDEVYDPTDG
jgi:tetratricopeptide (TPR) repeat protein